jgi:hypothetical protein
MTSATIEFGMRTRGETTAAQATAQDLRLRPQVMEMLRNLQPDERVRLVALIWVNRGLYHPRQWKRALKDATAAYGGGTAEDLIGLAIMSDQAENAKK